MNIQYLNTPIVFCVTAKITSRNLGIQAYTFHLEVLHDDWHVTIAISLPVSQ